MIILLEPHCVRYQAEKRYRLEFMSLRLKFYVNDKNHISLGRYPCLSKPHSEYLQNILFYLHHFKP